MTKIIFLILSAGLMAGIWAGSRYFVSREAATAEAGTAKFDYLQQKQALFTAYASEGEVLGTNNSGEKSLAGSVPVLLYHGILENSDGENVGWDEFWTQMRTLKELGWQTVSLEQLGEFLQGGKSLPAKSFVLTFDDGRRDSVYGADQVLKTLNYSAVMFVIGGTMDTNQFHLPKAQVKQMAESGRWEIEAHSWDMHHFEDVDATGKTGHALVNKRWLDQQKRLETDEEYWQRLEQDVTQENTELEKLTGKPVTAMAFPYGDYGQEETNFPGSRQMIMQAVARTYKLVFYQGGENSGWLNFPGRDIFMVKRIEVAPGATTGELLAKMEDWK